MHVVHQEQRIKKGHIYDDQLCSAYVQTASLSTQAYETCMIITTNTYVLTTLCSKSQLHTPVYVILNPPRLGTRTRTLE